MDSRREWRNWSPRDDEFAGLSILIVDDLREKRDFIADLLYQHGARDIKEAGDGFHAFEITKEWQPDLAIVDIMMDGIDGFELIKKWKDANRSIKVMIMSGVEKSAKAGLKAGLLRVTKFLIVPYHYKEMLYLAKRAILFGKPIVSESPQDSDVMQFKKAVAELIETTKRSPKSLSNLKDELNKKTLDRRAITRLLNRMGRVTETIAVKIGPEILGRFLS